MRKRNNRHIKAKVANIDKIAPVTRETLNMSIESRTQVLTPDGHKNIEDIKVGDFVYSTSGKIYQITERHQHEGSNTIRYSNPANNQTDSSEDKNTNVNTKNTCTPIRSYDTDEGIDALVKENYSHAEGFGTQAQGVSSHAEGHCALADGENSHAEGYITRAYGASSHSEGSTTVASAKYSHAEGYQTKSNGKASHAEGLMTNANGEATHAEGIFNVAKGQASHAEGHCTVTNGENSHAEGFSTIADGHYSHAEGYQTKSNGNASHAEGVDTIAIGYNSHAEGCNTTARGDNSHAEGMETEARGYCSHAEGKWTKALGFNSHVAGKGTVATSRSQFVVGEYNIHSNNIIDDMNHLDKESIFIVGCGTSNDDRSNALRVGQYQMWGGMFNTIGRGYAELFEWTDGNPNDDERVGRFVGIDDGKIHITTKIDNVFGVTTSRFAVCGNVWDDHNHSEYDCDIAADTLGEKRLHNWQAVTIVGSVVMCQDGTVIKNGYVMPNEHGIATNSPTKTPYRVLRILDYRHILVIIK